MDDIAPSFHGEPCVIPADLFVPSDALLLVLEEFSGPMDLLLYLIKRSNMRIEDIQVLPITKQYMDYLALAKIHNLILAADYLVMAAFLIQIKSQILLPNPPAILEELVQDNRNLLIKRLKEYEEIKHAAQLLDALPRHNRDVFSVLSPVFQTKIINYALITMDSLVLSLQRVMQRQSYVQSHEVIQDNFSVKLRKEEVLNQVMTAGMIDFMHLLEHNQKRIDLIVTFLAMLELVHEGLIFFTQSDTFAPIYLSVKT
jgi:segregation and condensation protein A